MQPSDLPSAQPSHGISHGELGDISLLAATGADAASALNARTGLSANATHVSALRNLPAMVRMHPIGIPYYIGWKLGDS
ncbi:MAG: hypothetical protein ABL973_09415 [Micropepsaceae bacterium]